MSEICEIPSVIHTHWTVIMIDENSSAIPQRSALSPWVVFTLSDNKKTYDASTIFDTSDKTMRNEYELSVGLSSYFIVHTKFSSIRIIQTCDCMPSQFKKLFDDNKDARELVSYAFLAPSQKKIPITYTFDVDKHQKTLSGFHMSVPFDDMKQVWTYVKSYIEQYNMKGVYKY